MVELKICAIEQTKHTRKRTLDKAGVDYFERDSAKIVKKADGTTQVYHGGFGRIEDTDGDRGAYTGPGH